MKMLRYHSFAFLFITNPVDCQREIPARCERTLARSLWRPFVLPCFESIVRHVLLKDSIKFKYQNIISIESSHQTLAGGLRSA